MSGAVGQALMYLGMFAVLIIAFGMMIFYNDNPDNKN